MLTQLRLRSVLEPYRETDLDQRLRLQQTVASGLAGLGGALLFGLLHALQGRLRQALLCLAIAGALALSWTVVRYTRSLRLAVGLVLTLCTTLLITLFSTFEGLIPTYASVSWLMVLPPVAGLLAGRRAMLVVGSVTSLYVVVEARAPGLLPRLHAFDPEFYRRIAMTDFLAAQAVLMTAVGAFERTTRLAREARERSTEALRTEVEERRRAEELAHEAVRAQSAFFASMSHEIRTPMNGVLGMARALSELPLGTKQRAYLDVISSSAESLLVIINDILDLSKLEAGKMSFERRPFDLRRLIEDVNQLLARAQGTSGLELRLAYRLDTDVVIADHNRTRQVLLNLVGNAVKFTPAGHVEVRVERVKDTLRVEIEDTGIGIPAERQAVLFEPFSQADVSTSRRFGGTGLGLTICRQLVEGMGGSIGLRSEPGEGSTFWFELPYEPGALTHSVDVEASHPPPPTEPVLVVDDSPVNLLVAQALLENQGWVVETADSGLEALERARGGRFALILMDVEMPELDGFETTRQLRDQGCELPIIGLSANVMDDFKRRGVEAGMNDYVGKPIDRDELLGAMHAQL